jgi:integrase
MVITQAGLGLRIAELLALRVQDVDFLRRTARIEWQLWPDGKRRVPPKTPRSRRMLAVPNVVAEFRYGKDRKSDAKAWQMWQANEHRWIDHGYLIEDCKLLSLSRRDFPTVRRPRRDSNARHPL